jgi:hypothetical protein
MAKAKKATKETKQATQATQEVKAKQEYSLLATVDVKKFTRGFLAEFLAFVAKKEVVTVEQLVAEFNGRQIDGHKVTPERVKRYVSYCMAHELFKKAGTRETK